jgi:hypothetical protein
VLVEAVTGRVPFASDTALGTLAARTQEPITAPDELGPLGRVVERAGRPLPAFGRAAAGLAAGALTALALVAAGDPPAWAGSEAAAGGEPLAAPLTGAAVAFVLVALLPRVGWLIAATGCVAALAGPWPDAAALVAAAAVVPPLLLRRRGLTWSVPAAAPALGLAGLAGAYPAVAGRVRGAWARAALGAAGLWWLLLAEPLLARDIAIATPPGSAGDVLETLAASGALLLAPLWAAAALVLPVLVRGRALALDVVGAAAWAAALASGTAAVAGWAGLAEPRGLAAGAVVAGVVAVVGAQAGNTLDRRT